MKKFFILMFITFLFVSNHVLSQIEVDTNASLNTNKSDSLGRIPNIDIHNNDTNDFLEEKLIKANDTIGLCIYFVSITMDDYDRFCNFLDDEAAILIWSTFYEETDEPMVSILIRRDVFERTFNAKLTYKRTAASSHDGFIWQLYIESYIIPEQFKNIINYITLTDPQTGGC